MRKLIVVMTVMMMALFALPVTVNAAEDNVAKIGETEYATLQKAIDNAEPGATIELISDIEVERGDKVNNQGLFTITKNLIITGNGHSITAIGDFAGQTPSMFNVEGGDEVVFDNIIIDSNDKAKHGINIFTADGANQTKVNIVNVTIKNGTGYGVVCNGSFLNVAGLETSGNEWGGINVDCTASSNDSADVTIEDALIQEENSVYVESTKGEGTDITAKINGGSFNMVSVKEGATADLTVNGGEFSYPVAKDYLANGLVLFAWSSVDDDGNVTGSYYVPMTLEDAKLDAVYMKDGIYYSDAFDAVNMGGLSEEELEKYRIAYQLFFTALTPAGEVDQDNCFALTVPKDEEITIQDVLNQYETPPSHVEYDGYEFKGWWTIDEGMFYETGKVKFISGPLDLNSVPEEDMSYYSSYSKIGAGQGAGEGTDEATGEANKGADKGPKTGDDFNMAALIAIMGITAAAAMGTVIYGRKKRSN